MRRSDRHSGALGGKLGVARLAAASLALAGTLAAAGPARAETSQDDTAVSADHDTVVSALETPARGRLQLTGSNRTPFVPGEPLRVLGGAFIGSLPVWKVVSFELGGLGYRTRSLTLAIPKDSPAEMGLGVMAGLRLAVPSERLRPYATARIAHIFGAADDLWRAHPIENLAGKTAEYGVRHSIGASLGAGFEAPLGLKTWSWRPVLDIGVRVTNRPTDDNELAVNCQVRFPG